MDTGRRPEEICACRCDCLARDPDGAAVLIYDNRKANRLEPPAADQRDHRRRRSSPSSSGSGTAIPDAPDRRARAAPRPLAQPQRRPLDQRHRPRTAPPRMGRPLPTLRTSDGAEFDKTRAVLYAYRHSYAQRHADAGVADRRPGRASRSPQPQGHPPVLPGRGAASPRRGRHGDRAQLRPTRQPDLARRPRPAGLRARPLRRRRRRRPLRPLHRTGQRQGRRRGLPGPVPLRGLRPLPHRRRVPPRADRPTSTTCCAPANGSPPPSTGSTSGPAPTPPRPPRRSPGSDG